MINTNKYRISSDILNKMYNQKIVFNQSLQSKIMGKDTTCNIHEDTPKIVVYFDSNGCTPCRIKLNEWKEFMQKINIVNRDIQFIFIFATKKIVELNKEIILNDFSYPIYFDYTNSFEKINKLPREHKYHTFMLNNENKIILVGNPVLNNKIEKLYLREINKRY